MVHRREPDRIVDTSEVVEIEESRIWPSRERYLRTYEWCNDDDTASQMHAAYKAWMRAGNGIDLAVVREGEPVSFAVLWRRGSVAQIEDVATLEEHRGQGLSRAVVTRALDLAYQRDAELVFLVADADDWPRDFYAKLGFDELTNVHQFLKTGL
jgi:GNAT superfamily N-acetyltransferase